MRVTASKYGIMVSVYFLIFALLFRLLLPFGDEPDYSSRSQELLYNDWPSWSPYYWLLGVLQSLNSVSSCFVDASVFSTASSYSASDCLEETGNAVARFFVTIVTISPILLLLIFRSGAASLVNYTTKIGVAEANARLDSIGSSLLIPGFIYYIGLLSPEQLSLAISLLVFIFWGSLPIIALLMWMILDVDPGNGLVVLLFIAYGTGSIFAAKFISFKTVIIFQSIFALFSGVFGKNFTNFVDITFIGERSNSIYELYSITDFYEVYPIVFRVLYTYVTSIIMTPSGIKVIPIYIIYTILILFGCIKLLQKWRNIPKLSGSTICYKDQRSCESSVVLVSSAITLICCIDFIFPSYANAKYYEFLLPFVIRPLLFVFDAREILNVSVICCLITIVTLIFFVNGLSF